MKISDVSWDKVAKVGFVLVSTFAGVSAVNSHMEVGKMKVDRVAEKASAGCPVCAKELKVTCKVTGELVLPKK